MAAEAEAPHLAGAEEVAVLLQEVEEVKEAQSQEVAVAAAAALLEEVVELEVATDQLHPVEAVEVEAVEARPRGRPLTEAVVVVAAAAAVLLPLLLPRLLPPTAS